LLPGNAPGARLLDRPCRIPMTLARADLEQVPALRTLPEESAGRARLLNPEFRQAVVVLVTERGLAVTHESQHGSLEMWSSGRGPGKTKVSRGRENGRA